MSQIVIVSGPPGAGKSTVCEALCERYDRTVHLETDDVYAWIRMGFVPPWKHGSGEQNVVVSRAAARAAAAFAEARYGVFVDGIVGPHLLPLYIEELKPARVPVHFVLLLPAIDDVLRRFDGREKRVPMTRADMEHNYAMFREPYGGKVIDSGAMSAQQTADAVMDACGRGAALVWAPD